MTTKEFITKLEIVADMGDKQIETLANLIIEYVSEEKKIEGFKHVETL